MIKKKAKMLLAVLVILCLITNVGTAFAADDRIGEVVDGSLLTNDTQVEYKEYSRARGTYLNMGSGSLSNLGGRKVYMSGSTSCFRTSDQVKVTLFLQRLEGGSWVNTGQIVTGTSYNTYEVSAGDTFSVTGGYYYRVYGSHIAIKGSTSEACSSYSDGLWVS